MSEKIYSVIIGSGSYIPTRKIKNEDFMDHVFYEQDGKKIPTKNEVIIRKFSEITGIFERRYVTADLVTSDIAYFAAKDALDSANVDPETLDYLIVAHNFGDIKEENKRSEFVPTLASRVKNRLAIKNPNTICYDLPFGCAGWLQAVIQANLYISSGVAKRVLCIGAETLSRIADPHDRDSMIYADGAGAMILEAKRSEMSVGILSSASKNYAGEQAYALKMGRSNNPDYPVDHLFLKMQGRMVYEQALSIVPVVVQESLDKAGITVDEIDKLFIHQANNKMDEAILKRMFEQYGAGDIPEKIMPMTISWLGNSSVATLPTLYDLVVKNKFEHQTIARGSIIVFVSVGAGININSVVYKVPK
jgi:3-oxoacyl-[acyl-carrier-protein] synthase III